MSTGRPATEQKVPYHPSAETTQPIDIGPPSMHHGNDSSMRLQNATASQCQCCCTSRPGPCIALALTPVGLLRGARVDGPPRGKKLVLDGPALAVQSHLNNL